MVDHSLLSKYNTATPRYTSYPTVPCWSGEKEPQKWFDSVSDRVSHCSKDSGISLYIHLPFCESLCTYCGCNKRITKNHSLEKPYIDTLLKEWELYKKAFKEPPIIQEIHLGGGTPTFFSGDHLEFLISNLLKDCLVSDTATFSFEAHPQNTELEHLQKLYTQGFDRVSYGIQDFDLKVQKAINRFQTYQAVEQTLKEARAVGYTSINFDLIYGLPFQTTQTLLETLKKTVLLKPDRIAYYSYAHVPWTAKSQRAYNQDDLPKPDEKLLLYHIGKIFLQNNGYRDIGMDHFAKTTDELHTCKINGKLNRNFMGYTTNNTKLLVGLGVSAISDIHTAYSQNEKNLELYQKSIQSGTFSIEKQHFLSHQQVATKKQINDLMCNFETELHQDWQKNLARPAQRMLQEMQNEELIDIVGNRFYVTQKGKQFVRNICTVFDPDFWSVERSRHTFSKSV